MEEERNPSVVEMVRDGGASCIKGACTSAMGTCTVVMCVVVRVCYPSTVGWNANIIVQDQQTPHAIRVHGDGDERSWCMLCV